MANIHGIGDIPDNNQNQQPLNNQNENDEPNDNQARNRPGISQIPFFNEQNMADPRNLNFFDTMRSIFCPFLKPISFIFVISIIQISVFSITLVHSSISGGLETTNSVFLSPNNGTLSKFGAKVSFERF